MVLENFRGIILIIVSAVLVLIAFLVSHFSAAKRLQIKFKKIGPLLESGSAEILKGEYLKIYHLYLKLSEKKKTRFYHEITALRQKIEEQMRN